MCFFTMDVLFALLTLFGLLPCCCSQCDTRENLLKLHAGTTSDFQLSITPNLGEDKPHRAIFGNGRRVMVNLNPEDCFQIVPVESAVNVVRLCAETRHVERIDFTFHIGSTASNLTQQRAVKSSPDWERTCISLRYGRIECVSGITICLINDNPRDNSVTNKLRNVFGDFCMHVVATSPGIPDSAECGLSQYGDAGIDGGSIPAASIVNGWEARPHEFPWQVMLVSETEGFFCAGVIVSSHFILTAAHCVDAMSASTVRVVFAEHRRSVFSEERSQAQVEEIIVIDNFTFINFQNDIALLRLACPIAQWTESVQPACLPTRPQPDLTGQRLTVAGWGTTRLGGDQSDVLLYTNLPLTPFEECVTCYAPFADFIPIIPGMLCAGVCGQNPSDACSADSGAALAWKNAEGRFEVYGLVSFGAGCAGSLPGVYTDVYFYRDWIHSHINAI